jgi:putative membrane protein
MNVGTPQKTQRFSLKSTLGRVTAYSLLLSAYSVLAVIKEYSRFAGYGDFPAGLYGSLGAVVSILLVFRTNSAYAKWWEARTLWGSLINASRNLEIKARHFVEVTAEEREQLADLLTVFATTLKDHLRHINDLKRVRGFEDLGEEPNHPPSIVASRIYGLIESWRSRKLISDQITRVFDIEARVLMEVCGGCERILNTRLAFSYRVFVNYCVLLYVLTLPWGLVQDFHGWTIPMTFVVSFLLVGLEIVAYSVESPFGHEADDLDLEGLCATLDRSVHEIGRR